MMKKILMYLLAAIIIASAVFGLMSATYAANAADYTPELIPGTVVVNPAFTG